MSTSPPPSATFASALAAVRGGDSSLLGATLARSGDWATVVLDQTITKDLPKSRCYVGDNLLLVALFAPMMGLDGDEEEDFGPESIAKRQAIVDILLSYGATLPSPTQLAPRRQNKGREDGQRTILYRIVTTGLCSLVPAAQKAGYFFGERSHNERYSLLHEAVGARNGPMLRALLAAGCDYTMCTAPVGFVSQTPVHAAVGIYNLELLKIFFEFEAESTLKKLNFSTSSTGDDRYQHVPVISLVDEGGYSLLEAAIQGCGARQAGHDVGPPVLATVRYLLDQGHVLPTVGGAQTVPHYANIDIIKLVLDFGCDPKALALSFPYLKLTHKNLLSLLLDCGLEVRRCGCSPGTEGGLSTLHSAVAMQDKSTLQLLLANGAGPDLNTLRMADGRRPIDMIGHAPLPTWMDSMLRYYRNEPQ